MMKSLALACCAVAALSIGCSALTRDYPVQDRFAIIAPLPTPSVDPSARAPVIRIDRIRMAAPFQDIQLIYRRTDLSFQVDYYNQLVAPPDRLITAEMVKVFTASGRFASVVDPSSGITSPLRLEGIISGLYGDFRDPNQAFAVVEGRFALLRDGSLATEALGQWDMRVIEPLPDAAAESVVAGYGRAISRLTMELSEKLAETAIRATAEPAGGVSVVR